MRINGDDSNLRGTADIFFSLSRLRRDDGTAAKLIQICIVLTRDKGRERESICVITRRKMFGMNHYRPPPPFLRISLFFPFLFFFFLQAIKGGIFERGDKNLVARGDSKSSSFRFSRSRMIVLSLLDQRRFLF